MSDAGFGLFVIVMFLVILGSIFITSQMHEKARLEYLRTCIEAQEKNIKIEGCSQPHQPEERE